MDRDYYLKVLETSKAKKGRRQLIKHLKGGTLTPSQAILAKCYDCTGFYADPQKDCKCDTCPLYQWMPFNPNNNQTVKKRAKALAKELAAVDDDEDDEDEDEELSEER